MPKQECVHVWEMADLAGGMIVMKKCFHCGKVSSCFCFHSRPPLEESHEGQHFWNFADSAPSFHFNLRCIKCASVVKLDELVGLMTCTGCDPTCEVDILRRELEPSGTRVCIALGRRPIEERKQLPKGKLAMLQKYFAQQAKALNFEIRVVPHRMVKSIDNCYAEIIKDAEALFTPAVKDK